MSTAFAYSDQDWQSIALILTPPLRSSFSWRRPRVSYTRNRKAQLASFLRIKLEFEKRLLEGIATRFLLWPSRDEGRQALKRLISQERDIAAAAKTLREVFYKYDVEFSVGKDGLISRLENIAGNRLFPHHISRPLSEILNKIEIFCQRHEDEFLSVLPYGQADPRKAQYLADLCQYWVMRLDQPLKTSVRADRNEASGPLVRFLLATTGPVLQSGREKELSGEAARHFVRQFRASTEGKLVLQLSGIYSAEFGEDYVEDPLLEDPAFLRGPTFIRYEKPDRRIMRRAFERTRKAK